MKRDRVAIEALSEKSGLIVTFCSKKAVSVVPGAVKRLPRAIAALSTEGDIGVLCKACIKKGWDQVG